MHLGWVDFSKEDRQRAFAVINLLQEKGAVDELGIGVVRDAFADYFFPGTSTIQKRAKYFLIVPYLLKEAGEGKYGKDIRHILRAVDAEEKKCAVRLLTCGPDADGIIGKRVLPRGWVARKPSDIYWNGIRTYGIFKDSSLSISEYIHLSIKLQQQKENRGRDRRCDYGDDREQDDEDAGESLHVSFWNLPVYKKDWRDSLTIELSKEEAVFLKNQIEKTVPDTLLAYLLNHHMDLCLYDGFSALTEAVKDQVGSALSKMMQLACDFNCLVYMARVRYNLLLSEGMNEEADREWQRIEPDCKRLAEVDLTAVFEKLHLAHPKTFGFLTKLQEYFQQLKLERADELIRKQEIQLKGINRAKLNRTEEYDSSKWIGGKWLDYRFSNARWIINDIYHSIS